MATIVVGDIHLKQTAVLPRVDAALELYPSIDRAVFLGDACDDWGADAARAIEEMEFHAEWTRARREEGLRVEFLVGNHDFCYAAGGRGPGTIERARRELRSILDDGLRAQAATAVDGMLCTHAGVTAAWAEKHLPRIGRDPDAIAAELNGMLADASRRRALDSCPPSRGGFSVPGPLWADLSDLLADPIPGIGQIVGHTPVETVAGFFAKPARGEGASVAVWACDTMSTDSLGRGLGDRSMLLVEDGVPRRIPTS